MDPLTFYTIGLARHAALLHEAEEHRRAEALAGKSSRWQRLIARLAGAIGRSTEEREACQEMLARAR